MNLVHGSREQYLRCQREVKSEETVIWRTALVELAMREGKVDPETAVHVVVMTHSARMQ